MDLTERALHVVVIDRGDPVAAGLGRPGVHPVVDGGKSAGRAEHHPLVVQLGGDQPPATVLLADQHLRRNADIVVVRGVGVVCAVGLRMIGVHE